MVARCRIFILLLSVVISSASAGAKRFVDRLPKTSYRIEGFTLDSAMRRLSALPLHDIEGVWRFAGESTVIVVERYDAGQSGMQDYVEGYRIILAESPNRALRPGTVIGYLAELGERGKFESKIYTSAAGQTLLMPKKFNLELADGNDRLIFERRKSAFSVNLWRLLPYLWRNAVHPNQRRNPLRGCVRVFPEPNIPLHPVYL